MVRSCLKAQTDTFVMSWLLHISWLDCHLLCDYKSFSVFLARIHVSCWVYFFTEALIFVLLIISSIDWHFAVYCVLADLYYGGDTFSVEQPQSFTCPYCGKMGFTETSLQEHVTSEHAETSTEVVSMLHTLRDHDYRFWPNDISKFILTLCFQVHFWVTSSVISFLCAGLLH